MSPRRTNTASNNVLRVARAAPASSNPDLSITTNLDFGYRVPDDTRSSVSSEKSDSKPPRSAMRRSSSVSKIPQSPRRVRFDFMGEEVLPTSSPQSSAFVSPRIPSPDPADDESPCASNLATDPGEEDDEHDAPPRKVSSSDALRALSRAPLEEDGTVWTVVNSDSDEADAENTQPCAAQGSPLDGADAADDGSNSKADASPSKGKLRMVQDQPGQENGASPHANSDVTASSSDDESSDDDGLSMAARKPAAIRVAQLTAASSSASSVQQSGQQTGISQATNATPVLDVTDKSVRKDVISGLGESEMPQDQAEVFYFEDDELESPGLPVRPQAAVPKLSEDLESDEDATAQARTHSSIYATSPAITIARPAHHGEEISTPSKPRYQPGTVGSYKGRPLFIPVLKNPELLAELEAKPVKEMVGSVHDIEPSDQMNPKNFEMALSAPRSFKERFMLEEMMEASNGLKIAQQ